jgi:IclR family acetate operon transcriptional repressor
MARTGRPATRRVAAVERALAVLDALAEDSAELGTNELARRTGLNASTVSRLLATLAGAGLVEHDPGSGRYRLGVRLVQLGNAVLARLDFRTLARPQLEALAAATRETATLSVPADPDAVTVDFVLSPSSVQSVAQIGRPSVAHATATGKVMLAFGGRGLPRGPLVPYTSATITDLRALDAEIGRVRARGWAAAAREREDDLSAVAAPVRGSRGELAAVLGVQGPAARFDRTAMRAAVVPLLERAAAVSHALGWHPTDEEGR